MNGNDCVPLGRRHGLETLVSQDTCVGDQDVYATEFLHGDLDNAISIFGREGRSDSFSTSCSAS
jgi:hypothetical protein